MNREIEEQAIQFEQNSEKFRVLMRISGCFTIFSSSISLYLILFKSPKQIGFYKWCLLNIVICCGLFDIYFSLWYAPDVMLPLFVVCIQGVGANLSQNRNYQAMLLIICVCLMVLVNFSIGIAFLYRLATIAGFEFQRWRTLFLILLVYFMCMTPLCFSFLYAMLYDPANAELEVREHPAIQKFTSTKACVYMSLKTTPITAAASMALSIMINFASMITNFVLMLVILRHLRRESGNFSKHTQAINKQFTVSLALQFALPALTIVMPSGNKKADNIVEFLKK